MNRPKTLQDRRRIYFIEKSFQSKFILKYCMIMLVSGLLTVGLIYFLAMQSTTVFFDNYRVVVKTTADFILPILIRTVLIVMAFVIIATVALTLFVSHKMAGPMYRFKEVMDTLGEGNFLSDFKIREFDQLQDFSVAFNEMIRKMRAQINAIKDESQALEKKLGNITENDIAQTKQSSLSELKSISAKLNNTISRIKS